MNRVELEGVIGHELSHVLDRDILVGTVVATVVGAAVLMSEIFMRSWFWGGGRGRRDSSGGDTAGAFALILFVVGIVLLIIAPLAGQLIKLSVSRNREYLADAQGVLLTRYPPGLISALEKIAAAPQAMRSANNATAHLWLEPALADPGRAHQLDGEDVLDAPPDPGSDQAPPGDVADPSRLLPCRSPAVHWVATDNEFRGGHPPCSARPERSP